MHMPEGDEKIVRCNTTSKDVRLTHIHTVRPPFTAQMEQKNRLTLLYPQIYNVIYKTCMLNMKEHEMMS